MELEPVPIPLPGKVRTDPDLAAKTMGAGDTVILPPPLIGSYRTVKYSIAEVELGLHTDAGPDLVHRLIERLKLTNDEIHVRVVGELERVSEALVSMGFSYRNDTPPHEHWLVWVAQVDGSPL